MTGLYHRPLVSCDAARPEGALTLAGGWGWFSHVEILSREAAPVVVAVDRVPDAVLSRLTAPRADIAGLSMAQPNIMGILNVTPDSFSDGGDFTGHEAAMAQVDMMEGGFPVRRGRAYLGGEARRGHKGERDLCAV